MLPTSLSGFSPLHVAYADDAAHIIYLRAHTGSSKKTQDQRRVWPEGRTLFLVNVPADATEREIVLLFKTCGTVEEVVFDLDALAEEGADEESGSEDEDLDEADTPAAPDDRPRKKRKLDKDEPRPPKVIPLPIPPLRTLRRTGHTAHVIFLDSSSLARALALSQPSKGAKSPRPRPWPTSTESPLGLQHYTALYDALRPPLDVVREHANTSIALHDYELAERKRLLQKESKYKKGEAIVDEDGFTLVTRGGAYGQAVGGGVGVASKKFVQQHSRKRDAAGKPGGAKRARKKEGKEKAAFYAFQVHEKKRNELLNLQKKWEEDKAAVEKLRSSRKFKPY
ncbi:hypothetical protein FA95DRAFT_1544117 [Auriscalpium vulgare]|uniref:Uncharacterized protein n=1 Tax=Auriscalpium vulgare TaxID=40419 RepID=A0ACB8RLQ1_9AGAM|nr:hypothetical protein FA95DRAFT_1544117 [Auriscalpium vulgare]